MQFIDDDLLLETYYLAVDLNLEVNFISLLREEIVRRNLSLNQ